MRSRLVFLAAASVALAVSGAIASPIAANEPREARPAYELVNVTDLIADGSFMGWQYPEGEWIAITRRGGGFDDVWRIRPDGTGLECLTCDHPGLPGWAMGNPQWRQGYILFQAEAKPHYNDHKDHPNSGAGIYHDLWVMDMNRQTQNPGFYDVYKLTDIKTYPDGNKPPLVGGSLHPDFSFDGKKMAWVDFQDLAPGACYADWRIAVADFVTMPRPHLENVKYFEPGEMKTWYEVLTFNRDATGIYFACNCLKGQSDRSSDLYYMDLATEEVNRITYESGVNGEPKGWAEQGSASPRGDAIAYFSGSGQQYELGPCLMHSWLKTELWLMNPDGSDQTQISNYNTPGHPDYVPQGVIVSNMDWNPDGTKLAAIVYSRGAGGGLKIFEFKHTAAAPTDGVAEFGGGSSASNTGLIAGIVGGVAALLVVGGGAAFAMRRREKRA